MEKKSIAELMREEQHDFHSLTSIMELLRSENGCPWDREQDHKSIRANLIEETYEAVEAIDNDDAALLREELGDVLLQVVFHARMSEEAGEFSMADVTHDICAKLIHRHPHIFGEVHVNSSDEVLDNWEKIKTEEKNRVGLSGTMEAVPPSLPALMRAQKLVKKASKEELAPDAAIAAERLCRASRVLSEGGEVSAEELKTNLRTVLVSTAVIAQQNHLDAEEILYNVGKDIIEAVQKTEKETDISALSGKNREFVAEKVFFGE